MNKGLLITAVVIGVFSAAAPASGKNFTQLPEHRTLVRVASNAQQGIDQPISAEQRQQQYATLNQALVQAENAYWRQALTSRQELRAERQQQRRQAKNIDQQQRAIWSYYSRLGKLGRNWNTVYRQSQELFWGAVDISAQRPGPPASAPFPTIKPSSITGEPFPSGPYYLQATPAYQQLRQLAVEQGQQINTELTSSQRQVLLGSWDRLSLGIISQSSTVSNQVARAVNTRINQQKKASKQKLQRRWQQGRLRILQRLQQQGNTPAELAKAQNSRQRLWARLTRQARVERQLIAEQRRGILVTLVLISDDVDNLSNSVSGRARQYITERPLSE